MNYSRILEALLELKAGIIEDKSKGICFNLNWKLGDLPAVDYSSFIHNSFVEIFGEYLSSPVEGDIIGYLENTRKWDKETDMGLRRLDLLDKMIAYAEQQLNLSGEQA